MTTQPPSYPHTYRPNRGPQRGASASAAIGLSLLVHVGVAAAVIGALSGQLAGGRAGEVDVGGAGDGGLVHIRLVRGADATVRLEPTAPAQQQGVRADLTATTASTGSRPLHSSTVMPASRHREAAVPDARAGVSKRVSGATDYTAPEVATVMVAAAHASAAVEAPDVMAFEAAPSTSALALDQAASGGAWSADAAPGMSAFGSSAGSWPGPGEVDHAARPRRPIRPRYPGRSRRRGEESTVLIRAWIDERGEVFHASVLESGGKAFDDSAHYAVHRARFVPARNDGVDVASHVSLRIYFALLD